MKRLRLVITAVLLMFLIIPSNVLGAEVNYTVEENKTYTRIYGDNRYFTSIALADTYKDKIGISKFRNIIVASGTEFADALGGSYLSYVKQAPILISNVKSTKSDDRVIEYVRQNLASSGTVYILGGTAAVSEYLESKLKTYSINVKRLYGNNRYLTNIEILKEAGIKDEEIIVATGKDFADSLSASALKRPILLVKDKLNASQLDYLKTLSSKKFYVVGGENAVNNDIVKQLSQFGSVERIAGSTRYETSVQIARKFFDHPEQAVVAYGQNYPDGLCGGPLAMALNSPIILTRNGKSSSFAESYNAENGIASGYVLGGNTLISDATAKLIFPDDLVGNAYAVLKDNGDFVFFRSNEEYKSETTGTFKDTEGRTYKGVIFGDFEEGSGETLPAWMKGQSWGKYTYEMKKVYVAGDYVIQPHSMYSWFSYGNDISSFDFSGFDTGLVDNMKGLFENNISITELDLSMFDTGNVTDMTSMFENCRSLKELDLSSFATPNLRNLDWTFYYCLSLEKLDISGLNTGKISSMKELFYGTDFSEITLGSSFTVWLNNSYLPNGYWTNGKLIKSETELYEEYPNNSKAWAGTWKLTDDIPDENTYSYAVLQEDGDLIFLNSHDGDMYGEGTITDINGNEYTGYIFDGIESGYHEWISYFNTDIKRAYVAEGQSIVLPTLDYMFANCVNLKEVDMTGFNTSEVDSAIGVFENCYNLVSVNLNAMDTSYITDMSEMFYGCASLEELDLSSFDTSGVTQMSKMFARCNSLRKVVLGTEFTTWVDNAWLGGSRIMKWKNNAIGITLRADELYERYPENASSWAGTWEKQPLDVELNEYAVLQYNGDLTFFTSEEIYSEGDGQIVSDINGNEYAGKVFVKDDYGIRLYRDFYAVEMGQEYPDAFSVKRVYVADGQIIHYNYFRGQFAFCRNMTSFDFTGFDTSGLTSTEDMFYDCQSLSYVDLSGMDFSQVTNMDRMFWNCRNMSYLNVSGFNTENLESMYQTFAGTWNLYELDLSSFDTSNVTNMNGTFNGCRASIIILPDTFDTGKVTDMQDMFYGAENVRELNLKRFNTGNVENMMRMFAGCYSLEKLDLKAFDTRNVRFIEYMFHECHNLTSLDISSFELPNLMGMYGLFMDCSSLTELDISNFKPEYFRNSSYLFNGCSSLKTIYADRNFSLDSVTVENGRDMFSDCQSLIGGNGTAYDEEHVDYTYARIDKPGEPGYFTVKH